MTRILMTDPETIFARRRQQAADMRAGIKPEADSKAATSTSSASSSAPKTPPAAAPANVKQTLTATRPRLTTHFCAPGGPVTFY